MVYMHAAIQRYLSDHAEEYAEKLPAPGRDLRLCVVIPSLAEREGIGKVLDSLPEKTERFEVIVVVNHSAGAPGEVVENNRGTVGDLFGRALVLERVFAPEVAGVGAARRAGMDLALSRLWAAGLPERSAIACLDADSPVDPGYVEGILSVFDAEDPPAAGVCRCLHPIPEDPKKARAIVAYELWLRYLVEGFKFCGSPYAFLTIGSCTVVSPKAYALADGMPRRQAGEDFYFLQKVAKTAGRVVDLDATVRPSARISDRVPFGTGRAMRQCRDQGPDYYLRAEPPRAFCDLKRFFESSRDGFQDPDRMRESASPLLRAFIDKHGGWAILEDIRENSADGEHFTFAVHTWFDSLQVVRYARRCKAKLGGVWILDALSDLGLDPGADLPTALQRMRRRKAAEKPCASAARKGIKVP
jgi:glycosyltransferase involved in cell wall biosynthesis